MADFAEYGIDRYPAEVLGEDSDDGTMPDSLAALGDAVIGHRIVSAERAQLANRGRYFDSNQALTLTLDNGTKVQLAENADCCAYTEVESFLLNPELVDHVIMGVGTTDGYYKWHIYADAGDVMSLDVG